MKRNFLGFIWIVVASSLSLGAVRKDENPILNTQTNPIAHKQKMDEIKDGEKSAPGPAFIHYSKSGHQIDPPIEKEKKEEPQDLLPNLGDSIPENISEEEAEESNLPEELGSPEDENEDLDFDDELGEQDDFEPGFIDPLKK